MANIFLILPFVFSYDIRYASSTFQNSACYKYQCDTQPNGLVGDECVRFNNNVFYLKSCQGNTTCSKPRGPTFQITTCKQKEDPKLENYPGEFCSKNQDCLSMSCNTQVSRCTGLQQNQDCTSHFDCDAGLYCFEDKCHLTREIGFTGCIEDADCGSNGVCNIVGSNISGECIPLFSKSTGEEVSDCIDNISFACASGSCKRLGLFTGTCIQTIRSAAGIPKVCVANQDCKGVSGSQIIDGQCSCGYNSVGDSFCRTFVGDTPGSKFLSYLQDFYREDQAKTCNSARKFETKCYEASDYYYKDQLVKTGLYFHTYWELQSNDQCVQDIMTPGYWHYKSASALVVSLLFLLVN